MAEKGGFEVVFWRFIPKMVNFFGESSSISQA